MGGPNLSGNPSTGPAFDEFFRNFENVLLNQERRDQNVDKVFNPETGRFEDTGPFSRAGGIVRGLAEEELALTRRFAPQFIRTEQRLNEQAIQGDPLARRLRGTALSTLRGVDDLLEGVFSGDLPDDVRRSITEDVRGAQSARGILESGVGAVEEASRLAGGRERFRSARIQQVAGLLSGVAGPGLSLLNVPSIRRFSPTQGSPSSLGFPDIFAGINARDIANTNARIGIQNSIAGNANNTLGSVLGGIGSIGAAF